MTIRTKNLILLFLFVSFSVALSDALAHLEGKTTTVLLTGGTGYIGSHIAVNLLENGYNVVLLDDLSNSDSEVVSRIESATDRKIQNFYPYDLKDITSLRKVFQNESIDAVIHLAGFKAVGESVQNPLTYYRNNIVSAITLLDVMKEFGCHRLIFSSSATVYGNPKYLPIDETHPLNAANPYGRTKQMIEEILMDVAAADNENRFIALRYFNPIGAHKSGLIGERPTGIPQNLMPYLLEVVEGKRTHLSVFGNDYPTNDGTAVRDYIHVMDLAEGHLLALESILKENSNNKPYRMYNLGTGVGYSVMEMIGALSTAFGRDIPYVIEKRRSGDVAQLLADPSKAFAELGFKAKKKLEDMMVDSLTWIGQIPCSAE